MTEETSAGAVVYFKEEGEPKFLILHYEEGHWDFPKGHIIVGEKLEETALREIKEESGLDVILHVEFKENFSYFFKNKEGVIVSKRVYFFIGQAKTKEVSLSDEHIGYAWLSFEHAEKKLTYDNAKEVLKKAHEFLTQRKLKDF
jgi:bis(5'-nucleosidyl)-tetraphosphatase